MADAARELGVRALGDVDLNLLPVSFIVAHLFAVATDRDESPQRLDHGDVLFELGVLLLDFLYICGDPVPLSLEVTNPLTLLRRACGSIGRIL